MRKHGYIVVGIVFFWVSLLVKVKGDRNEQRKAEKEVEKNIDWDYAGLQIVGGMSDTDIINYHNLKHMRRERIFNPNQNWSASREAYENGEYRRLYNAVFSTKPPHLRTSEENYIQFRKDEFWANQRIPENPKTSRERYEWHVKKQQGSFFGGKYDFDTYLAGNFTTPPVRRRRDMEDKLRDGIVMEEIRSNELKNLKFADNVANIINRLWSELVENTNKILDKVVQKRNHLSRSKEEWSPFEGKRQNGLDKTGRQEKTGIFSLAGENRKQNQIQLKRNIRNKRVRRGLTDMYLNYKKSNWNRSWYLDPRNPWNKNLRFTKHLKLFDEFYLDFYTREGSDRLPTGEDSNHIRAPPGFHRTRHPYSAKFDSKPVSHFVKEMQKMGESLSKYNPDTSFVYARPPEDFVREARNKNYSAILAKEELAWKKQLSQIKYNLRLKNITKTEHDRMVGEVEKDKKAKYSLYRTRTTKHIVRQAMEALSIAKEFAKSCILRDKRDVGSLNGASADAVEDFKRSYNAKKKTKRKRSIISKREKRKAFDDNDVNLDVKEFRQDTAISGVEHLKRHKRSALEELLKGPATDKFEPKKTKLEADVAAAAKKPGVDKEINIEGTEFVQKKLFHQRGDNVHEVEINKEVPEPTIVDSRLDPTHPDQERCDLKGWREQKDKEMADAMEASFGDSSLGIRDRMYQDYLKLKNETKMGFIDRGQINRMELERAHKERAEFLKRQPSPSTTTEKNVQRTVDPQDLSFFESKEKKRGKKKSAKERMEMNVEELRDWRKGIL